MSCLLEISTVCVMSYNLGALFWLLQESKVLLMVPAARRWYRARWSVNFPSESCQTWIPPLWRSWLLITSPTYTRNETRPTLLSMCLPTAFIMSVSFNFCLSFQLLVFCDTYDSFEECVTFTEKMTKNVKIGTIWWQKYFKRILELCQ